ncbi:MAG TPA: choice-of-anchor D domain-containing protein [Terriglobales bacterium]|nr:choice-of-anchor D domain-containing protein [Terriglobales bacterium]
MNGARNVCLILGITASLSILNLTGFSSANHSAHGNASTKKPAATRVARIPDEARAAIQIALGVPVNPGFSQSAIVTSGLGSAPVGISIDDAGDTIVAARIAASTSGTGGGAVVFSKAGSTWSMAAELDNPDSNVVSVAISGDGSTILVGSCFNAVCLGHAYVYVKPTGGWVTTATPDAILSASDASATGGDRIGFSVATDQHGLTAAVGAPCEITSNHTGSLLCGSVYVFTKPAGGWSSKTQDATLTVATVQSTLGSSVSIDAAGGAIVAGATGIFASHDVAGNAFVFLKPSGGWTNTTTANATLSASDGVLGDLLGSSVAISGDGNTVVAGAPNNPIGASPSFTPGPGAAYVFLKPSGGWSSQVQNAAKLKSSDGQSNDFLGGETSISGDGSSVVVSALLHPFTPPPVGQGPGAAYVFERPSGTSGWNGTLEENQELTAAAGMDEKGNAVAPHNQFGHASMTSDGGVIAAGGSATVAAVSNHGAAYVFGATVCSVTLSPATLGFGSVNEGSSSAAMPATLNNNCGAALNNIVVSVTGTNMADFTQTNSCGSSLAAHTTCTIDVTFRPSTSASENATLSVADSAASSPQTASLTGTGQATADFTLASTSATPATTTGSTDSATVTAGNAGTYVFTLKSLGGFNSAVAMNAAFVGTAPGGTNLSLDQVSVTPTSSGVQATLTATTQARHGGSTAAVPSNLGVILGSTVPGVLLVMVLFAKRSGKRRLAVCAAALGLVVVIIAGSSCSGCRAKRNSRGRGTPAGTYTITVTGTGGSGAPVHTAQVTLVVQ